MVTELLNKGTDTVNSTLTYTLADKPDLENLTLLGVAAINATGNEAANILTGNGAANQLFGNGGDDVLDGKVGADRMTGGAGHDTYFVDNAGDVVIELTGEGTDTVNSTISFTFADKPDLENITLLGVGAINATGNALANTLTGNAAANVLDGGLGADTMIGGAGNDTYVVDNAGDIVDEPSPTGGVDLVRSALTFTLADKPNLENLTLTGTADIDATGNDARNVLTGNTGANTLDGGLGADTLIGGTGNDTYVVDNALDVVSETLVAGGIDTVRASVSWILGANLENLELTGASPINATGNTLANTLTGNDANNTLNGLTGADTMIGADGNDTYFVDNLGDVVTELANEGTDTVNSTITHSLAVNVENLTLTGIAAINGTGNVLGNTLTGNAAANTLTGGIGADTINGAAGNDRLIGGADSDVLTGGTGNDRFVFDTLQPGSPDTITDFVTGADKFEFDPLAFTAIGPVGTFSASGFVSGDGTTAALDADDRLIFNHTTGDLYYDQDGTGAAGTVLVATLNGGANLHATDIIIA